MPNCILLMACRVVHLSTNVPYGMVTQRVLFWLYMVLMDLCQWTDWGCWRLIQSVLCLLYAVSQTHANEQIEDVEGCLVDSKCVVFTVCSVTDSCQWTDWGCWRLLGWFKVCCVYCVQCHRLMPVNRLRMLKVVWLIQSVLYLLCAVSQTHASEQIEDVGMQVVGWYHSHPTFAPNPSVRDIETQQKFQVSYKYEVKLRILCLKLFWFVPVASKQPDLCVIQTNQPAKRKTTNPCWHHERRHMIVFAFLCANIETVIT